MRHAASTLIVSFVDEEHLVDPESSNGLVFGRGAALDLDSNPFLHRRVGRFVSIDGLWWVENLSAWTPITVTAEGSSALLRGEARVALVHAVSVVRFDAGSCTYELRAHLPDTPDFPPAPVGGLEPLTATYRPLQLPLTDEQRLLVVALAEDRLRNPHATTTRLPSNQELAARLGWSTSKFNRKLDWLCQRLDRVGVTGMRSTSRRANSRRQHLVDYMVTSGQVTADDLELLQPPHLDEER